MVLPSTPCYRVIETALGVSVAWAVAYVPKLIPPEQADESESTAEEAIVETDNRRTRQGRN